MQLSSEVARLTSQQDDVERQIRQMARQRDLAQSQEDQLRSQVSTLQASASLVPQLQHQIEVRLAVAARPCEALEGVGFT